jgi:hypothetical protein
MSPEDGIDPRAELKTVQGAIDVLPSLRCCSLIPGSSHGLSMEAAQLYSAAFASSAAFDRSAADCIRLGV